MGGFIPYPKRATPTSGTSEASDQSGCSIYDVGAFTAEERCNMKKYGDTLTTGQASKLLGVSITLVNRLVDRGDLKGFRVPGSRHRRILKGVLLAFMREHSIPIPKELEACL